MAKAKCQRPKAYHQPSRERGSVPEAPQTFIVRSLAPILGNLASGSLIISSWFGAGND